MSRSYPSNNDDILDSRDIIKRIEELESEHESLEEAVTEAEEALVDKQRAHGANLADPTSDLDAVERSAEDGEAAVDTVEAAKKELAEWEVDSDGGGDLKILKDFAEEAEGYSSDWTHGTTLIRESYFEKYAQEFADDIGAVPKDLSWPATCIDWEQAAEELQQDYTGAEFDGVTYYFR